MSDNIRLLDCTLRDGSYQVNFRFTKHHTKQIALGLANSGIRDIEVGHGVGIGASEAGSPALETDVDYAKAAQAGAPGLWGMFAIPSIASLDGVRQVYDEGLAFLRIGVDIDAIEEGLRFATQVRKISPDLRIYVNFMKSYVATPDHFDQILRRFRGLGISGIYLVDSAGGMLSHQIQKYGEVFLGHADEFELGFHGHDNLGLAVSHSLTLARMGFDIIDTTLHGIGRSAGNAPTERILALLILENLCQASEEQLETVLALGERAISPLSQLGTFVGLDTMAGFTSFHSSYMDSLVRCSVDRGVSPYKLMSRVSQIDKIRVSDQLLHKAADSLPPEAMQSEMIQTLLPPYSEADKSQ